jgi:hypothetical protein
MNKFVVTWLDESEHECFQECENKAAAEAFVYGFLRSQPIIFETVKVHEVNKSFDAKLTLE